MRNRLCSLGFRRAGLGLFALVEISGGIAAAADEYCLQYYGR